MFPFCFVFLNAWIILCRLYHKWAHHYEPVDCHRWKPHPIQEHMYLLIIKKLNYQYKLTWGMWKKNKDYNPVFFLLVRQSALKSIRRATYEKQKTNLISVSIWCPTSKETGVQKGHDSVWPLLYLVHKLIFNYNSLILIEYNLRYYVLFCYYLYENILPYRIL